MNCRSCAGPVSKWSKSGLCRVCIKRDPEFQANRIAKLRLAFASRPEVAEGRRKWLTELNRTPEARARSGEQAHKIKLWEHGLPTITPEVRKRAGATARENRLVGIPHEVRDLYLDLIRLGRLPAAEAREITLAHHETMMARFRREIAG